MNILITGASGQLGSGIAKKLKEKNLTVDSLKRGDDLKQATMNKDIIIHCAAVHPRYTPKPSAEDYIASNINLTHELIQSAIKSKVSHFIFFSTYYLESYNVSPNLYSSSKLFSEVELQENRGFFKSIACVRLPMIVDVNYPNKSFLAELSEKIKLGEKYQLSGESEKFPFVSPEIVGDYVLSYIEKGRTGFNRSVLSSKPILTLGEIVANLTSNRNLQKMTDSETKTILNDLLGR